MAYQPNRRQRRPRAQQVEEVVERTPREKYDDLFRREHEATRWYQGIDLSLLGLQEEVERLFANVGAKSLLEFQYHSCRRLTCQFLSTYKLEHNPTNGTGSITFKFDRQAHQFSITDLNETFDFPFDSLICSLE